jgi:hypothetical protein
MISTLWVATCLYVDGHTLYARAYVKKHTDGVWKYVCRHTIKSRSYVYGHTYDHVGEEDWYEGTICSSP